MVDAEANHDGGMATAKTNLTQLNRAGAQETQKIVVGGIEVTAELLRRLEKVKVVILDADGVLRYSLPVVTEALKMGLKAGGIDLAIDDDDVSRLRAYRRFLDGRGFKPLIAMQRAGISPKEALSGNDPGEKLDQLVSKYVTMADNELLAVMTATYWEVDIAGHFISKEPRLLKMVPKAGEGVGMLNEAGYKLAVFSGAPRFANQPLAFPGLDFGMFAVSICGSDSKEKPDPEGINIILNRLGLKKDEAIYVGDMASDIQTARNAGVIAVSVLTGDGNPDQLKRSGTDLMVKDLSELGMLMQEVKKRADRASAAASLIIRSE